MAQLKQGDFETLASRGLVQKRVDQDGYTTYRYKQRIFYDNLWDVSPLLLEARGIVFDKRGNVAQRPFKKVFNIGENGTYLDEDLLYAVARKVNGFMLAVSNHNGNLLVSTTGTTTSDYAKLGREWVCKEWGDGLVNELSEGCTYLFEVVDESDPHIVWEEPGAYLIGIRNISNGNLLHHSVVENAADSLGFKCPETFKMTGREILSNVKDVDHEGFAIYSMTSGDMVSKIKSPHYLSKKALMRMGKKMLHRMFHNPNRFKMNRLDEEFYGIFDKIVGHGEQYWSNITEQERRKVIEDYFYEGKHVCHT